MLELCFIRFIASSVSLPYLTTSSVADADFMMQAEQRCPTIIYDNLAGAAAAWVEQQHQHQHQLSYLQPGLLEWQFLVKLRSQWPFASFGWHS